MMPSERNRTAFICSVITFLGILDYSHCRHLLEDEPPVVEVDQGRIVGVKEVYANVTLLAFRSIPYAKPPVDELRFMAPEPPDSWDGELDATKLSNPCVQIGIAGTEDCLFLNVYTPENALNLKGGDERYAVMVYIHGGAFVQGSAAHHDRVYQTVRHGVITVVMQYRLGIIGFFSTGDDAAPGNQGLLDQTMALRWVNKNIAAFGGDPTRITLFGQSAGSASTHLQILSPLATGLFRNAILQSGNAFCPWSVGRDFYNASRTLAGKFGCPLEPSKDLVSCLQGVNAHLLNNLIVTFSVWNFQPFIFAPRVDGTFLPKEPPQLVKDGDYNKVPTIMGMVKSEGALVSAEMFTKPYLIESLLDNFAENGPASLQLHENEDPINTTTLVYHNYLGGLDITEENGDKLTKLYTDRLFQVNMDWLVEAQADQSDVYMYEFNHRGQWSYLNNYKLLGLNVTTADEWVSHGDDIQYLFERDASGPQTAPEDIQVGKIYSTLFTNFAKFGNPTPDSSLLGFEWYPTNASDLRHLSIEVTPTMKGDYRSERRKFWESLPLRINDIL